MAQANNEGGGPGGGAGGPDRRPLRRVIVTLGAVMACLIAFSFLMGVSPMDISVKHQMQRHVVAEPFEAGDVVALSPDGLRFEGLLCDLDLAPPARSDIGVRARYYNLFDEMQGKFFTFAGHALALVGMGSENGEPVFAPSGLPFEGEVSRVVGQLEASMPISCWCDVAHAIIEERRKACVVDKSLVRTELVHGAEGDLRRRTTMGISFRSDAIWIRDPATLGLMCPGLNVTGAPPGEQSCGGSTGISFDVRARGFVGLIREAPLD